MQGTARTLYREEATPGDAPVFAVYKYIAAHVFIITAAVPTFAAHVQSSPVAERRLLMQVPRQQQQ